MSLGNGSDSLSCGLEALRLKLDSNEVIGVSLSIMGSTK